MAKAYERAGAGAANTRLRRTVNIGLANPAKPSGWAIDVDDACLDRCAAAGFSAIRLNVDISAETASAAPFTIDPELLERIETTVARARKRGLAVVVTNFLDPDLMRDPSGYRLRTLAIVAQLAALVRDLDDDTLLEPLAEPRDRLDPLWNEMLADIVASAREVGYTRPLVVGPAAHNTVMGLPALVLPEDPDLIMTIHNYWPIEFTFQGETWHSQDAVRWLGTTWEASSQQRQELRDGFAMVAQWAAELHVPVFLGEFGTTNHADPASRARWTRTNRELAEEFGFAWGIWSYGPTYAIYDHSRQSWHQQLLEALMKPPR